MKNEKTSKAVASMASDILSNIDIHVAQAKRMQRELSDLIRFLDIAKSVAASALTQARDKKRK